MPTKRKTRNRSGSPRRNTNKQHPKHFAKVYWPYLPILAVVTFGMLFGGVDPRDRTNNPATLAYATEMSLSGLLNSTNQQRANNGLGPLVLNSLLNSSAQSKVNDMVNRDYWSHNTPEGDAPWVFFDAAGYSYQKAGENLAYGFNSSADTVVGWMNSPSHRANILDTEYTEVGFGFANSANFVGTGEETVVVAHYAKPLNATPPPPPAPPAPAETEPQSLQAQSEAAPVEETVVEEPEPEPEEAEEATDIVTSDEPITTDNPVPDDADSTNITRLQRWTQGDAPWSALAVSTVAFAVVAIWLVKHAVLVKRFVHKGEHFVAHHPLLDLFVVAIAALAVYLSQSSGVVL